MQLVDRITQFWPVRCKPKSTVASRKPLASLAKWQTTTGANQSPLLPVVNRDFSGKERPREREPSHCQPVEQMAVAT